MRGRPVVAVTRPAGSSATLSSRLQALGLDVLEAPAIRLGPPRSFRALDRAAEELREGGYAAVAFTSSAAIEAVLLRHPDLVRPLRRSLLAVVGPATAAALHRHRLSPVVVGKSGGAALAAPLARAAKGRVLLPRAEEGNEELPLALRARGVEVDVVPAYRTRPASRRDLLPLERALAQGRVAAVIVASPSAVEALRAGCPHLSSAALVAIGETTAAAARTHGLEVSVADRPSDAALARAARKAAARAR